ncbi:hypothetical protein [Nostoc sp.]|uniref:hypothetical protein n=1 Tax=Nostoc sp. TaxID=1180 RepID=UPI002FF544E5
MKLIQHLGNTGAIAILQIQEKEQAFKAAVARLERAKAGLNPSDANVAIAQEFFFKPVVRLCLRLFNVRLPGRLMFT